MPAKRTTGRFEIELEHEGKIYRGYREVHKGKHGKTQIIFFNGHEEIDTDAYKKDREGLMEGNAELIIINLIHKYHRQ